MTASLPTHSLEFAGSLKLRTPSVTICVLTYGDHPELARQSIESIRRHCARSEYKLIVGANAVGAETCAYLESLRAALNGRKDYRRSGGLMRGDSMAETRPRCEIYASSLKRHLR